MKVCHLKVFGGKRQVPLWLNFWIHTRLLVWCEGSKIIMGCGRVKYTASSNDVKQGNYALAVSFVKWKTISMEHVSCPMASLFSVLSSWKLAHNCTKTTAVSHQQSCIFKEKQNTGSVNFAEDKYQTTRWIVMCHPPSHIMFSYQRNPHLLSFARKTYKKNYSIWKEWGFGWVG